jgi:hypothetical protein
MDPLNPFGTKISDSKKPFDGTVLTAKKKKKKKPDPKKKKAKRV